MQAEKMASQIKDLIAAYKITPQRRTIMLKGVARTIEFYPPFPIRQRNRVEAMQHVKTTSHRSNPETSHGLVQALAS